MKVFLMVLVLSSMACGAEASWRDAVVKVQIQGGGRGTGFFVAPGIIMTAKHVVAAAGEKPMYIQYRWVKIRAQVVSVHNEIDLALLAIRGKGPRPLRFCEFVNSDDLTVVTRVHDKFESKPGVLLGYMFDRFVSSIPVRKGDSGSPVIQGTGRDRCVAGMTIKKSHLGDRGTHISGDAAFVYLKMFAETLKQQGGK
jgi:hypothetical protein